LAEHGGAHQYSQILGGGDWEGHSSRTAWRKVSKTPSYKLEWWFMPRIPAMWEVEWEDHSLELAKAKNVRLYLKK
jgi:hypothetical protein